MESQANFLPADLFDSKESLSLTTSPIALANGALQNKKTNAQQPQTSQPDRKSTRLNSSHRSLYRMPASD